MSGFDEPEHVDTGSAEAGAIDTEISESDLPFEVALTMDIYDQLVPDDAPEPHL